MRTIGDELQAHLDGGTTTLCWCWRITRLDGARYGFTDHDRDIEFDDCIFEAATGFTSTEIKDGLGLSVDNLELEGALRSDRLAEASLAAGDFDNASVEIFRVNWSNPGQRTLMRRGSIGEIRRGTTTFIAEVRGLAHYLNQPRGRVCQYACDADLGDARCGIDLSLAAWRAEATVAGALQDRSLILNGLSNYPSGLFTRGLLAVTTGPNRGRRSEIRRHWIAGSTVAVELWTRFPDVFAEGESVVVTAGCDKQFGTCIGVFANALNYRGFPHMPGNDFLTSTPTVT